MGVNAVFVDLPRGEVEVGYNPDKTQVEMLRREIVAQGYMVEDALEKAE